ncbi:MAG: transposase [bacterium]|nr:transposase [bacterium]
MRKEKFIVNHYYHIYNRGSRKAEIVRDTADKWRFMQALRFFNDSHSSAHILRQAGFLSLSLSAPGADRHREAESVFDLGWPPNWPDRDPLVKILCYSLIPNHFHLLLKEISESGISKFMHKLGMGYANFFNLKYHEVGSIFQGPYKAKLIKEETYLKYLTAYIQVINVLELYPGGFERALENFSEAMEFLNKYSFSSHPDYAGLRSSLIVDKDILGEFFPNADAYRKFVLETIVSRDFNKILGDLTLE